MKSYLNLIILIFTFNGIKCSKFERDEHNILILDDSNFDEAVETLEKLIVLIYAPMDTKSNELKLEYEKLSKLISEKYLEKITLAKVDITAQVNINAKLTYNLINFPAIFLYENINRTEYLGQEKAEYILKWIEVKTGLAVTEISDSNQLDKLIKENEVIILGLYSNSNSLLANTFIEMSKNFYDLRFAISFSDRIFEKYTANKCNGKIIIFKEFDEGNVEMTEFLEDKNKIINFINSNKLPLITDFHIDFNKIINNANMANMYLFIKKSSSNYPDILNQFERSARKFRGKIIFSTVDVDKNEGEGLFEYFGLKNDDIPVIRLTKVKANVMKYKPETSELTTESISKFSQDFIDGKIAHYLLTQDVPKNWNSDNVKILVGKNFNQTARNRRKSVLVSFYAPWCLYSIKAGKILKKVAEEFKRSREHLIAEIDATANEIEDIRINKFPTIFLFPKNSDEIVEYSGEITEEAIINFLENHGKPESHVEHDEL